jgi:hypothetical protein
MRSRAQRGLVSAMSCGKLTAMLVYVALAVATGPGAHAQSAADADHTMRAMDLRMHALNAARKNLQQLQYHRDDQEADALREIMDADAIVFSAAVKVFTVAFFVKSLKSPEDVRFSQQQFRVVVQLFVDTAGEQLSRVDDNLRRVTAPAPAAEANTIRGAIAELRDFLQPFASAQ